MGVYKLTFPGVAYEASPTAKSTPFRGTTAGFMGRRLNPTDSPRVQPAASFVESPELQHFPAMVTDAISEDDSSPCTASTCTSHTISDDDISPADFAARSSTDYAPARHSTACCTDVALRRELRKKFHVEPALGEAGAASESFAMGRSFRRELEKEDRVESLALWEETEMPASNAPRDRVVAKDMALSWPGDTASSMSSRNKTLESIFRTPKKASNFFNGFFSGLTFPTSRRSRKS